MSFLEPRGKKTGLQFTNEAFDEWVKSAPKERATIEWIRLHLKLETLTAAQLRAVESLVNHILQPPLGE